MRKRLNSIICGTAFILAASGVAFAADIAVKAPPSPPPAPVYSWTGFYVGGNVGASFGRAKTDFNVAPVTVTTTGGPFTIPGFAGSALTEPSGVIGGGQIGYNWQFSPILVAGIEADIQASDEKDSITITNPFSSLAVTPGTGTAVTQYETKISWFGTVRGRIGYLFGDGAVMSYVTGGLAYGRVGVDGTSTVSGCVGPCSNAFSVVHTLGHSQVNTGWTVGTGTEGKLLIPGWTYRIESLYVNLGSLDDPDVLGTVTGATGGQIHTHTRFNDYIIRAGLNYQFH
jgi:outer membrane immunogenic protein